MRWTDEEMESWLSGMEPRERWIRGEDNAGDELIGGGAQIWRAVGRLEQGGREMKKQEKPAERDKEKKQMGWEKGLAD